MKTTKPLSESQIQKECVAWFRATYPSIEPLFFAVPNGGVRNVWTAKIMKDEGVRAGVADLILQVPKGGYATLAIEMKTPKGKQSESQIAYQKLLTKMNSKYVVCRSLEDFQKEIKEYLGV